MRRQRKPLGVLGSAYVQEIIKKRIPVLAAAAPLETLRVLAESVDAEIMYDPTARLGPPSEDMSGWWCPAIESSGQSVSRHEVKTLLVGALRDAAVQAVSTNLAPLDDVLAVLNTYLWPVFLRLSFFLLSRPGVATTPTAKLWLLNRANFDNGQIRHEYNLLLTSVFADLSDTEQKQVITWATEPEVARLADFLRQTSSQEPSDEDIETERRHHAVDRLRLIRAHLPAELQQTLRTWAGENEDLDRPDTATYVTEWVGPTSPRATDELGQLTVPELVAYLQSWTPGGDIRDPSPEGVGRQIAELVKQNPSIYAAEAMRFSELDPTYVRSLLGGLEEAIRSGGRYDWEAVLALGEWILQQPRDVAKHTETAFNRADPGWGWTRKALASLINQALRFEDHGISPEAAARVWALLEQLAADPEPTPEYEARFGRGNMDPFTLAINTVRPIALGCIFLFGYWLWRLSKKVESEATIRLWGVYKPLIDALLVEGLDLSVDQSLAVRAEYGHRYPTWVAFDPEVAVQVIALVFPPQDELRPFWDAAWEAYLFANRPIGNLGEILKGEYGRAVSRLGTASSDRKRACDPDETVAEHLGFLYWWGRIDLRCEGALLDEFFARANGGVRGHLLWYLGHGLEEGGEISSEIRARMVKLWEQRLSTAQSDPLKETYREECEAFGAWFTSRVFPDDWAINQLLAATSISLKVQNDFKAVPQIADLSATYPYQAIRIMRNLVEGDSKGWGIFSWKASITRIIAAAQVSSDSPAQREARELVGRLVARGHHEFSNMIS